MMPFRYKTSPQNGGNDIVFLGDSTCLSGVIPEVIEQKTGLRAINLGTSVQSGIIGYSIILHRFLENNPPLKLIIIYISPLISNMYSMRTFEQIFTYLKYGKVTDFIENVGEFNLLTIQSALITYGREKIFPSKSQDELVAFYQKISKQKGYQDWGKSDGLVPSEIFNSRLKYGYTL